MSDDLVKRLRERAKIASEEGNMTAKCDANYFEKSADRIEELEAKLAKSVDFIEDLTGCEWPYDEEAKRILAELTGGKDE